MGEVRKVQFGCGIHKLEGWENHDRDVDITRPLPFDNSCINFILAEHVVEHVSHQQAFRFFRECRRVLIDGGVVRVSVPNIERIALMGSKYHQMVSSKVGGESSIANSLRAVIMEWGHQSVWSHGVLLAVLKAAGFVDVHVQMYGHSTYHELHGVERHHEDLCGDTILAHKEAIIMEAIN